MRRFDLAAVVAEAPKTAPRQLAPNERGPVLVEIPGIAVVQLSYIDAMELHIKLGQDLARNMRRRGTSTQIPPDGNTPPLTGAGRMPAGRVDTWDWQQDNMRQAA